MWVLGSSSPLCAACVIMRQPWLLGDLSAPSAPCALLVRCLWIFGPHSAACTLCTVSEGPWRLYTDVQALCIVIAESLAP